MRVPEGSCESTGRTCGSNRSRRLSANELGRVKRTDGKVHQVKPRAGPLGPVSGLSGGSHSSPRRARSHHDLPPEAWLDVPVPPLVDAAVFAVVQGQRTVVMRKAYVARDISFRACCAVRIVATRTTVRRSARRRASTIRATTLTTAALAPTLRGSEDSECAATAWDTVSGRRRVIRRSL